MSRSLLKYFDSARLRTLLALFFLALVVPTAFLIWQAYGQLKWESFHQYRGAAEEVTGRIDARLMDAITEADRRSFADYGFLVVTGDPSANFVQRSPLSAYPVSDSVPGTIGYFQVGAGGEFSTPLLPSPDRDAAGLGITGEELARRVALASEIHAVLADNQLVRSRPDPSFPRQFPAPELLPESTAEKEADERGYRQSRARSGSAAPATPPRGETTAAMEDVMAPAAGGAIADRDEGDQDAARDVSEPKDTATVGSSAYSQQVFDQLAERDGYDVSASRAAAGMEDARDKADAPETVLRKNTIGKVSDLQLDEDLQRKSEDAERVVLNSVAASARRDDNPARAKRREQIALPESSVPEEASTAQSPGGLAAMRISTFESELDPFEFSLLDSGHFVIFRNVWRDGERFIQGLLIDQDIFVSQALESSFRGTALFDMSNLIVAYQDDVIYSTSSLDAYSLRGGPGPLDDTLLYRASLSAPLEAIELIYSIRTLPAGPGASILAWVTIILAIVFTGGFLALYRLGLSQIRLARQQQDFVSAVSHELKTPLTSIRMYGEMLKEGWADEDKRQSYYEFIHDESERLTRLISNVLQLAKITRNEPHFHLKREKVAELLSNIESKISNQAERAGFTLTFSREEGAAESMVHLDADCFTQIVINLVDNAIKFSKNAEKKAIDISCGISRDKVVVFSVRDYGPGVPKDQLKKIFGLFYRSESELTRETVGTGIGLAIVHQLTLAMSGSLDVINRNPGAEFRVSFPVA
jgi:signal transduction histidine kinase